MIALNYNVLSYVSLLIVQIILLILFWIFVRYDEVILPSTKAETGKDDDFPEGNTSKYPYFQDVHVMVFVGLAFLMTFLHKYGYSATGYTLLLAALGAQWTIIMKGFFHMESGYIKLSLNSLVDADFAAEAPLLSMGVVFGRTSPMQLLFMVLVEIPFYALNLFVQSDILSISDVGGSFTIHAFGAYFGLGVSLMMRSGKAQNVVSKNGGSNYTSDIFAMIGTLFLWVYWPSFNSVSAVGHGAQERAIVNTYLSLASATVTTFAMSALVNKDNKLSMSHIQNSTLAGGVAAGSVCNLLIGSHGAVLLGIISGVVSVLGYQYLTPAITAKLRIDDVCGVHNLHGMPALISAIASAIYACLVTHDTYKDSMVEIFPAMASKSEMTLNSTQFLGGYGRTSLEQGGYQFLGIVVTVLVALVGGIFTGILLKGECIKKLPEEHQHLDEIYWEVSRRDNDGTC